MSKEAESNEPAETLLRLLGGKWLAAAISAAASLGLADVLAHETLSLDDLASRIDCQPDGLQRLMRVLLGEGIVFLNAKNQYELSEMGELLRKDELRELARFVGSPFSWDPWSALAESVQTGESAFAKHHGLPLFEYLDHHREHAELYHHAIDAFSRREAHAVAAAYDFSTARRVADIGGGRGRLLIEVLSRWDHLTGVLFERPTAAAMAAQALQHARLENRCEVRIGDFFEELPDDVDVCVLMHIIHSWDDATATRLLRRCADAVGPDGTLLIIEGLLVPDARRDLTNLLDLEMLVLCGPGHERRKPEMRRLISAAGLRLHDAVPLVGGIRLLVVRPRSASGRDD
jgi:SAM-dependent methyltransferase